jgi:hypothetical protein
MGRLGKARRRGGLIARKEEQRSPSGPARLNRVRSVLTKQVKAGVAASDLEQIRFKRREAVNCRF